MNKLMKLQLVSTLFVLTFFLGCSYDRIHVESALDQTLIKSISRASITGDFNHFILPDSDDFDAIPQDFNHNPLTSEKVALGKLLFYETGLALSPMKNIGEKTYSCASCHVPTAGFRPGGVQGIADGGIGFGNNGESRTKLPNYEEHELDVQGLRPLSMLNVAFVENTTWNGRFGSTGVNEGTEALWALDSTIHVNFEGFSGIEAQNVEGMEVHRMEITDEVLDEYGYRAHFDAAYGDLPLDERYSKTTAALALSAYLRTLFANEAPFQSYLKGDIGAMNDQEKRGAIVFFTDAKCYLCHKEKNLGANEFYALGVNDLYQTGQAFNTSATDNRNLGRGGFSTLEEDMYKFKVPQLYNLGDAHFYFHGSSQKTLVDVVNYFNDGIPENSNVPESQIARNFKPLELTEQQKEDLVVFLQTGLQDANLDRYVPESILSGLCFPNNDFFSKIDLGCE